MALKLTRLRAVRELRAMSQEDLATASGIRRATVSQLERGENAARPATLRKLARALKVGPEQLVDLEAIRA